MKNDTLDDIIRLIVIIAVVVVIGFVINFFDERERDKEVKTYNNGICTECGGDYQFTGASGHATKKYYYTCDKCGHTIEMSEIMK
jgi:DNA-directed RNA polymerase subunit RPC12/RpoP